MNEAPTEVPNTAEQQEQITVTSKTDFIESPASPSTEDQVAQLEIELERRKDEIESVEKLLERFEKQGISSTELSAKLEDLKQSKISVYENILKLEGRSMYDLTSKEEAKKKERRTREEEYQERKNREDQELIKARGPELTKQAVDQLSALEEGRSDIKIVKGNELSQDEVLKRLEDLPSISKDKIVIPDDVVDFAKQLKERMGSNESELSCGPVYSILNSKGERVIVRSFNGINFNSMRTEYQQPTFYFLATDEKGQLIGARPGQLESDEKIAQGTISTFVRGSGAASAIDSAFSHFLQRTADSRKEEVDWQVHDENLGNLEKIRNPQEGSDVTHELLAEKEQEHQRWLALYGESGKFGFSKSDPAGFDRKYDFYKKTFKPLYTYNSLLKKFDLSKPEDRVLRKLTSSLLSSRPFLTTEVGLEWNNSELIAEETMMQDEQGLDSKRTTMLHEQLRKILAQLPD